MRRYVFYHPETGALHARTLMLDVSDMAGALKNNTPDGHIPIEHETAHPADCRFEPATGAIVPALPPPRDGYEWDADRHRWRKSA